jgi:NAD(P)-dependent dehydrogenase (short-subunit alcohol dehydrogenase family)
VALVTGASRGIGEEIARTYALAGAKVVACSRKKESIEKAAQKIQAEGGKVLAVTANVSIDADRERLVKTAIDWAGKIDILVNNVGANPSFGPLADLPESSWDKVFDVNLKATFFLSQRVYHAWMKDHGGAIVNVSSVGGYETTPGINAYNVAKAALLHLTRCLAKEWGENRIRVNALAPGLIKTQFSRALWDGPQAEEKARSYPLSRLGEAGDLAGAALLLAGDASSFITGHILTVDGGALVK